MDSAFTHNPIKVHHIDYTTSTSILYVFVGAVPRDVKNNLSLIKDQTISKKHIHRFKALEKFYGKRWPQLLGLTLSSITGGAPQIDSAIYEEEQVFSETLQIVSIDELIHFLDDPILDGDISINDVLMEPDKYQVQMDRIKQSKSDYPIILYKDPKFEDDNQYLLLEGIYRLGYHKYAEATIVPIIIVPVEIAEKYNISSTQTTGGSIAEDSGSDLDIEQIEALIELPSSGYNIVEEKNNINITEENDVVGGKSKTKVNRNDDDFDIEQIEALLETPKKEKTTKLSKSESKKRKRKPTNTIRWITDYQVYPTDKVSEFKEKIAIATNIYPFQQHLWYKTPSSKFQPIAYNVWIDGQLHIPNLLEHIRAGNKELIDSIPIDMNWYHKKDHIRIDAYDDFRVLEEYYNLENVTTYYMIDIDSIIPNIALKEIEIVYYGCIQLFFPMISTILVFRQYLKNQIDEMHDEYPQLVPKLNDLHSKFKREMEILNLDPAPKSKMISSNTLTSITAATITLQPIIEQKISIRNIYDKLHLSPQIIYTKINFLHDGKRYESQKRYISTPPKQPFEKEKLTLNSLLIVIRLSEDAEYINVILLQNGVIIIKSQWREEYYFGFNEIVETIQKMIEPLYAQVNAMGAAAFGPSQMRLTEFKWENLKFSEINMSLFWKQAVTAKQFEVFENILKRFEHAGLIELSSGGETNEFMFKKGMYQFDPSRISKMVAINNQYEYLTDAVVRQKWITLFGKTRRFNVDKRFSDIRMNITGIREEEYKYFFRIIRILLFEFVSRSTPQHKTTTTTSLQADSKTFNEILTRRQKKALTDLKERDPELYNTKKLYGEETPYSKICQKPFQPVTLEEHELKFLPEEKRQRAIKYYNFTTHKDIWYYCPQEEYKWIKFLTHRHPKGYCIPCCKKTPPAEDTGSLKEAIHNTCLTTHEYHDEKKTLTEGSRYITSYGKSIDAGRLSNLPEGGLTSILMSKLRLQQKSSARCIPANQKTYYVVGVPQNHPSRQNVGLIFALSDAAQVPLTDFLRTLAIAASHNRTKLRFTELYHVFGDLPTLVEEISSLTLNIDWNMAIQELAFLFADINTLILEDPGDGALQLVAQTNTIERLFPSTHKTLIVIHNTKQNTYFPIYELVSETFFRTGMVDTRLFSNDHAAIKKLTAVVAKYYNDSVKSSQVSNHIVKSRIDMDIIEEFTASSSSSYKITGILLNSKNLCYLLQLGEIYIPIIESTCRGSQYKIITTQTYPIYGTYKAIIKFATHYNKWISQLSAKLKIKGQTIYPIITPTTLLVHKGKPIGFESNGLNFYCTNMPKLKLPKSPMATIRTLIYDPIKINTALLQKQQPTPDWRMENEGKILYEVYLYRLFITEVHNYIMQKKNAQQRTRIKSQISKADFAKPLNIEFYEKLVKSLSYDDAKVLIEIVKKHIRNKKNILRSIDATHFQFDDFIEELKSQSMDKVTTTLRKELASLFHIGERKIDTISNIITPCASNPDSDGHCFKSKLTLKREQFNQFTTYLAYVITSPRLHQNVFASIDVNNTIDFFDFEERPTEVMY
jgi:hypothetical protein